MNRALSPSRSREQEGAHHEAGEHDDQQRQEDLVGLLHTVAHAQSGDHQAEGPYEQQGDGHPHHDSRRVPDLGAEPVHPDVVLEEGPCIVAPGDTEGEEHVPQGPGHNYCVIGHDDEADEDLEPAQPFQLGGHAPEDRRRRATEAVSQGVVEEEDRQPGRQQRDDVGDDEGAAAVGGTMKAPPPLV